jgi:DNA-binding NtrC family response regulator
VREGRLRQDLYYRLNAVSLRLPPLRERREDIMALARRFAARARPAGAPPLYFPRETAAVLERYEWPGNIRELENAVVRAAALCDHAVRVEDLPDRVRLQHEAGALDTAAAADGPGAILTVNEWVPLAEVEGRYVMRVLEHTGGNKQAASRVLGVDRKTLQRMIHRHRVTHRGDEPGAEVS